MKTLDERLKEIRKEENGFLRPISENERDDLLKLIVQMMVIQRKLAAYCFGPNWHEYSSPITNLGPSLAESYSEIQDISEVYQKHMGES